MSSTNVRLIGCVRNWFKQVSGKIKRAAGIVKKDWKGKESMRLAGISKFVCWVGGGISVFIRVDRYLGR